MKRQTEELLFINKLKPSQMIFNSSIYIIKKKYITTEKSLKIQNRNTDTSLVSECERKRMPTVFIFHFIIM